MAIAAVNQDKQHKPLIKLFDSHLFPLKSHTDFNLWNNIVFVDLDLNKDADFMEWMNANYDSPRSFRTDFIKTLTSIFPDNFYAFENSSSQIGIHMFFYYDVEKTEVNHLKCALYTRNRLIENIDTYMPGLKSILLKDGIFDEVYKRPWQNCFITGINQYIRTDDISGCVDLSGITIVTHTADETPMSSSYCIENIDFTTIRKETLENTDHMTRFRLATALKSVTANENEWYDILAEIFRYVEIYRKRSTAREMLRELRYNTCNESALSKDRKISLLHRYGIKVDRKKSLYKLDSNEYLGNVIDDIIDEVEPGITLLQAGTGVGKTRVWTDLNDRIMADQMEMGFHKPILIIEPYNSIIENKYDRTKTNIIIGTTPFPRNICSYGLYVTNFNKLLSMDSEGWTMKSDWQEFFRQFELVIIDESHIAIKDAFRKEVLAPFIKMMREVGKEGITKVILQTATPMDEDMLFTIDKHIIIDKPSTKQREVIFRSSECRSADSKDYNLEELTTLVKHYRDKGRKVYIYWSAGSVQMMKRFRDSYEKPARVAIYHKKNSKGSDYKYIAEEKMLGDRYDILISSIYFGVGNDLNDTDKAAVIIVGNNSWQEDIQAIGRFRNSNDVNTCIILTKRDMEFIAATSDRIMPRLTCVNDEVTRINRILYNAAAKDKSVTINGISYGLRPDCIKELAVIKSSNYYHSTWVEKMKALKNPYYGLNVIEKIEPIRCDWDYTDTMKAWNKSLKKIRDERVRGIIEETYDVESEEFKTMCAEDGRINDFYRAWKRLRSTGIAKDIDPAWMAKSSSVDVINRWCSLYNRVNNRKSDWPEILSLLWFRRMMDVETEKEKQLGGVTLKPKDYWAILAYTVWVSKCNSDEEADGKVISNVFKEYRRMTDAILKMPIEMIEAFYKTETMEERGYGVLWEFLGMNAEESNEIRIHSLEDIHKLTMANGVDGMEIAIQCLGLFDHEDVAAAHGVLGGRPTKRIVVTDAFNAKKLDRYGLSVGDEFSSAGEMANALGFRNPVISKWIKNGWVAEKP